MTLSDSSVVALIATLMRADAGSAKRGSTLPSFDSARMLGERVAGTGEQLLRACRVEGDGDLLAARFVERRIGNRHRRHEARQLRSIPRDVLSFRILDRDGAERAGLLQVFPADVLVVREQRAGNARRAAGQQHHDLALQIEAGQIVVLRLREPAVRSRRRPAAPRRSAPARCASRTSPRRPAPPAPPCPMRTSERLDCASTMRRLRNGTGWK